ncbi:hypothetical protein JX266_000086 [Neoarthrinium moseri]|nr:hypothetical protein JX266_000086 [Neoarthrinium moseri]
MLSHLRFHRRDRSNPTSPIPESSPWDSATLQPKQLVPDDGAVPAPAIEPRISNGPPQTGHGHGHGYGQSSQAPQHPQQPPPPPPSSSQAAPSLPPIARVTSSESQSSLNLGDLEARQREEQRPAQRTPYTEETGFLGGLALQNYRREQQESLRPGPSEKASSYGRTGASAVTSPTDRAGPSFVSPTDLHPPGVTGKRPPGARLATDSQVPILQSVAQEPARDKRGLPFLKNPISTLLLRRKTSQNVLPDLSLPIRPGREEPSYQPIRGTRVHDFSAPRPRRIVSSGDVASLGVDKPLPDAHPPPIQENESPPQPAPPVPPKDARVQSIRTSSSTHSRAASADAASSSTQGSHHELSSFSFKRGNDSTRRQSSIPSSISTLSRNPSGVSNADVLSSVPRHMKSTSSRFSFDMIGAAKAEKALEEKHRQRQQERKVESSNDRDSRYDDFDEDAFDYDAMDYDDGFEEAIPGVNVDYVDDDYPAPEDPEITTMDPDDDQENFAGFVFQRSNPVSSMTSPLSAGLLPTPRDADGNVIGFAMTKESPDTQRLSSASLEPPPHLQEEEEEEPLLEGKQPVETLLHESPTGLGIQGLDAAIAAQGQVSVQEQTSIPQAPPRHLDKDDELYFGGLGHEFEGEGDGSAIDEALFDLDDTDQYGRPIPGMFANALAQRMNPQDTEKRASDDLTSRFSAQSGGSQSTAHTSLSAGLHQKLSALEAHEEEAASPDEPQAPVPQLPTPEQEHMAAYQAALAAAAHKAAASGKFRRDSSPPPPADVTITSPTTSGSEESNQHLDDALADYDYDDGFGNGLDDYELDDDAIIAEANASALASDDDGWYGQEFGFYSAPLPIHRSSNPDGDESGFYGGFFGPSGVTRSKSGHLVSREPNLTPITERSEYSNRNSIMSLQMPNSANRDTALQSPGLAQLVMMADDDNMSLSALMRLRSKAWGGSQASLVSSREGSPGDRNGASSPMGQDLRDAPGPGSTHGRKNSAFSIWSQESGAGSSSGSPTLTMATAGLSNNVIPPLNGTSNSNPNLAPSPLAAPLYSPPPPPPPPQQTAAFPPVIEDEEADTDAASTASPTVLSPSNAEPASPTVGVPSQRRPGMGHRHRGSADSISYTKEQDSGETRWVLERRRTAESGEVEILGREVVEGGRI